VSRRELLVVGLLCFAPPLVAQLRMPAPRIDSDAVEYYSHLRSLYQDRDLDLANEFEHFGVLTRADKAQPTRTGMRRSIYAIGPSLMWMPFYAAGDLVARARGELEDGYSEAHIRAVCLGSLVYGVAGLLLLFGVLRELVPRGVAVATALLVLYATFLYWYLVHEPLMSHAASFFMAALVLRVWWSGRERLALGRGAVLGLLIGVAACVRWQNAVLLLLPAATLLRQLVSEPLPALRTGVATLVACGVGALPQLLAWKTLFGEYLLAEPPQGRDFLRLGHPFLLETFFSSRHGLLYWTPLLWAGYLGYFGLARRRPFTAIAAGLPLLVMSYVNACSGDWWAGGSFSNRRFDSVLPLLALGLAVSLQALRVLLARRPVLPLALAAVALTLWNGLFMEQYRRNLIPRDDVVSFARVTENSAALVTELVGTPLAWPANWVFAARHKAPLASHDVASGKYLFYKMNNLGGVIDLGDPRVDPALLLEGWARVRPCDGATCRGLDGPARLLFPLDVPEALELLVRAQGGAPLRVSVNGHALAELPLGESLVERRARIPAGFLRREHNELSFDSAAADVLIDRVVFQRLPRAERAP
jgi:hypothetical protein